MAIYRGSGGSTSTTDQATIDQVAEDAATATTKAAEALSSASSASSSASSASSSASTATTKASEASTSASNAASSASNASTSESNASGFATAASNSATSASGFATNAASEASAALASKGLALDAQTAAETAESNASDHADDAVKAAYGAEDVLQTLSDSSTLYSARHYAAKASADSATATTKASEASSSASAAASSASAASASADAALAALDNFDDRYLGTKTSDPTLDNDGNALVAGALYFNTTDDVMKVYEGSTWVAAYASVSGALLQSANLSDLANAATARTNLGVAIGTDVQAYSSVLAGTTASYTTAEETKLAGIEAGADVTDTANVTAAGALMDSEVTNLAQVKAFSSADYATAAQGTLADSAVQPADNVSTLNNDAGYLTSYTETDPVYTASSWYTTTNNSTNWNTAYGWGDHSSAGYLTGNQTITLSGDVSGSGTTSISVTIADDSHNHVISNVDGLQTALDTKASTGKAIAMAIVFG